MSKNSYLLYPEDASFWYWSFSWLFLFSLSIRGKYLLLAFEYVVTYVISFIIVCLVAFFSPNVPFLCPLKTPENQRSSGGIEVEHWAAMD